MDDRTVLNLTDLLLAEKEEKRQLYNRLKNVERERDQLVQLVGQHQGQAQELKNARKEIASLCALLDAKDCK